MYSDPKHIRDHVVKVRFNEEVHGLLELLAQHTGTQKAVLARELIERGLQDLDSRMNSSHPRYSLKAAA